MDHEAAIHLCLCLSVALSPTAGKQDEHIISVSLGFDLWPAALSADVGCGSGSRTAVRFLATWFRMSGDSMRRPMLWRRFPCDNCQSAVRVPSFDDNVLGDR